MRAVFDPSIDAFKLARENFGENLILNDGFDAQSAEAALQAGEGKAVSFARHFIANPDLVQRMRQACLWPGLTATRSTPWCQGLQRLCVCRGSA